MTPALRERAAGKSRAITVDGIELDGRAAAIVREIAAHHREVNAPDVDVEVVGTRRGARIRIVKHLIPSAEIAVDNRGSFSLA